MVEHDDPPDGEQPWVGTTQGGIDVSRRTVLGAISTTGLAAGIGLSSSSAAAAFTDAETVSVGAGSYATRKPMPDESVLDEVEDGQYKYVAPSPVTGGTFLTDDASGPVPTNTWHSNVAWNGNGDPHGNGNPVVTLPYSITTTASGLTVTAPTDWETNPPDGQTQADRGFAKMDALFSPRIKIGNTNSSSYAESRSDDWGDFHTRVTWGEGTGAEMSATLVKGSPFVFVEYGGGDAAITLANHNGSASTDANVEVWADRGNVLGVSVTGITLNDYTHHFVLFAPSDATWDGVGTSELTSGLGSGDYLTVASLPEQDTARLDRLEEYAYNFVRETETAYDYVQTEDGDVVSEVRTTFSVTTEDKPESAATGTLSGLLPHQWKYATDVNLTGDEYWSPRGTIKLRAGSSFSTAKTYPGMLPFLPDEGDYDADQLQTYLDIETSSDLWSEGVGTHTSTYWVGKDFDHHLRAIQIGQHLGDSAAIARSLDALTTRLGGWLTVQDTSYDTTEEEEAFAYWDEFGSLTGYPAEFYSSDLVNDHAFHYGYFVKAAAEVARHDADFVEDYGPMVDLLIREFANWERPSGDPLSETGPRDSPADAFPRFRNFDPYEGHSWAAGAPLGDGNDQESSSEAMNAHAAVIRWAELTDNTEMRDVAIAMYTEEMHAIWEYWFDDDNDAHPDDWGGNLTEADTGGATGAPGNLSHDAYEYAPIVWGTGYHRNTFWGQSTMEEIWGINWLPVDGHSLYLGLNESYADANWSRMIEARGSDTGFLDGWHVAALGYRALSDPADAVSIADQELPTGRSSAHLYHWVNCLDAMGTPNQDVVADAPLAAVFEDESGDRTYVAYNADLEASTTVSFSDGATLDVPPNSLKTSNGSVTTGLRGEGGVPPTPLEEIAQLGSGSDTEISREEAQQAIGYWADNEPLPESGEELSLTDVQTAIDHWANNEEV